MSCGCTGLQIHTCDGGQGVRGDILGIHNLAQAGLRGIKGVKEAVLWPRSCCPIVFEVGGETFIEPQFSPVVTGHQVPKPLHTRSPEMNPGIRRSAEMRQQKSGQPTREVWGERCMGVGDVGGAMSNNNNNNSNGNSNNFDDDDDDDDNNK